MRPHIRALAVAGGATALMAAGTAPALAASASSVPSVIQNGHGVRTSVRPSSFSLLGETIHRIHWLSYGQSRAQGHSPSFGGTRVVFFTPTTSHGRHYFKRVFFQGVKMGSCWRWTWTGSNSGKYESSRYCPFH